MIAVLYEGNDDRNVSSHGGRTCISRSFSFIGFVAAAVFTLAACHSNIKAGKSTGPMAADAFTPVTVSPIGMSHSSVLGTDGLYHWRDRSM